MKSKAIDPWQKMAELLSLVVREPEGEGWVTANDITAKLGCGRNNAHRKLRVLKDAGKIEVFSGTQKNSLGRISLQTWYRPKTGN